MGCLVESRGQTPSDPHAAIKKTPRQFNIIRQWPAESSRLYMCAGICLFFPFFSTHVCGSVSHVTLRTHCTTARPLLALLDIRYISPKKKDPHHTSMSLSGNLTPVSDSRAVAQSVSSAHSQQAPHSTRGCAPVCAEAPLLQIPKIDTPPFPLAFPNTHTPAYGPFCATALAQTPTAPPRPGTEPCEDGCAGKKLKTPWNFWQSSGGCTLRACKCRARCLWANFQSQRAKRNG